MLNAFADDSVAKAAGYLSQALEGRDYLVGEITGADIQMSYVIEMMRMGEVLTDCPVLAAYMARLEARPAYRTALEKGGPVAISVQSATGSDHRDGAHPDPDGVSGRQEA